MLKRLAVLLALAGGLITHAHGQTYPGQFPAGSVLCNPTASAALLPQPCNTFTLSTGTSSINVATYDGVTNSGKTALQITNSDNSALTATEHYSAWFGATTNGTGDGSVPAGTYALGISAIKNNWTTSTVAGEYGGINTVCRGGFNNAVTSGDTACYQANAGVSFSNNFVTQFEGVSGYFPGGSTTGSLDINVQLGSIRATGLDTGSNTGIGFFAQAQNGAVGHAFSASNLCAAPKFGTCGKWLDFLNYLYDDGTHTAYPAFNVNQLGQVTLAGFGAAGTNQKTIRVGSSATNVLGITNAAASVEILSLTDAGALSAVAGITSGAAGGTGGSLTLNGATSGSGILSVSATGGTLSASAQLNVLGALNSGNVGGTSGSLGLVGSTSGTSSLAVDATGNLAITGAGGGIIKIGAAASFTANGAGAAVTFGATTPAAITTPATVFKWLTLIDNAGNTFYVPTWH